MRYRVRHRTTYEYPRPAALGHNLARLTPRPTPRQSTRDFRLVIDPEPAVVREWADYFGNPVTYFTVQEPHRRLRVTAEHRTTVSPADVPDVEQSWPWEAVRDHLRTDRAAAAIAAYQFAFPSPSIQLLPAISKYAAASFPAARPVLVGARELTARVHADFRYDAAATNLTTTLEEAFAGRRGVCQDFAHVMLAGLRSLGLAARYVSGYLLTRPAAGGPVRVGADASHAWVSVYCPDLGWVDFDPTNDLIPADEHIVLAWGREYADVSPLQGVILGGGEHRMSVEVDVTAEG